MADKYSILDFAEDVLKISPKPLIFQDIWSVGKEKSFHTKLNLTGKTPWQTLGARLFVDVRDNSSSRFIKVGSNPARFFLKSRERELSPELLNELKLSPNNHMPAKKLTFTERELHPLLAYVAYTNTEFNRGKAIFTKTIFHEKSKKSTPSEWVHPDMVGFYMPIEDWNEKLLELNRVSDSNSIKMYSFELKRRIDRSNYREYFFQTVSNSSWANEGYLVAAYIQEDDDFLSELERLCNSFGIGIIRMNLEDIDASEVLFPAEHKHYLDWELMNKLCEQNEDFEKFIDHVTKDFAVKTIHKDQYDKVMDEPDEYAKRLLQADSKP